MASRGRGAGEAQRASGTQQTRRLADPLTFEPVTRWFPVTHQGWNSASLTGPSGTDPRGYSHRLDMEGKMLSGVLIKTLSQADEEVTPCYHGCT